MLRVDFFVSDDFSKPAELLFAVGARGPVDDFIETIVGDDDVIDSFQVLIEPVWDDGNPLYAYQNPKRFLELLHRNYAGTSFFATKAYQWPPKGIELAFCPTGPGGGIDNSCSPNRGSGSGSRQTLKDLTPKAEQLLEEIESKYTPVNPNGIDTLDRHYVDGKISPERRALHEDIIGEILSGVPAVEHPTFVMLGGGSGSGKSTALASGRLNIDANSVTLDTDKVKAMLPEFAALRESEDKRAANYVHEESSHIIKEAMTRALTAKQNVILDGTGNASLEKVQKKVQEARDAGYSVRAEYVTVKTETAIQRAIDRAMKPGPNFGRLPPITEMRKNHKSVSEVVPKAMYAGVWDRANLWDSEITGQVRHVASSSGPNVTIHDPQLWKEFNDKANEDVNL